MRRPFLAAGLIAALWLASSPGTLAQMQQLIWMEEGVPLGRPQFAANCIGAGISCAVAGGTVTLTVPSAYTTISNEGVPLPQRTTVNFTGSPITCSDSGGITVCDVAAGAGNFVEKSIAVTSAGTTFTGTVTGQAWVTATSIIVCSVLGTTADGLTPEAIAVAGLTVTASNRVVATGFDITVQSFYGLDGTVRVHCTGA